MEYEYKKEPLILKEYGRNVQKLVEFISKEEDREKRTRYSHILISLMKQLNPMVKENDNNQRIWDHLFIMSDFSLDIDGPYPIPDRSVLISKPQQLTYKTNEVKYRHYGRNIELLIENAVAIEDEEEQRAAVMYVGKLMKSFYTSWNKENIGDEVIALNLYEMSGRKIDVREEAKNSKGPFFDFMPALTAKERETTSKPAARSNNAAGKRRPKRRR